MNKIPSISTHFILKQRLKHSQEIHLKHFYDGFKIKNIIEYRFK